MNNLPRIAASVVLYNSPITRLSNINTYRTQVERLYVVDNSEGGPEELATYLKRLSDVTYLLGNGNEGIATALNRAAQAAIADGFDFLLTMDDDTAVPDDMISEMRKFMSQYTNANRVGILSASHDANLKGSDFHPVLTTMTSGNLLNLSIYQKVGPFRDDFFIDHVDHEYGLRLNHANFQVIELPNLQLNHQLGERKSAGWGQRTYISHAPVRSYYIIRNGLVLVDEYHRTFPSLKRTVYRLLIKEIIKAIFLEPQKGYRLRLLWRGLKDGNAGKLGKLVE